MFTIVSAKLTGAPGDTGWAQVHEFVPENTEKTLVRGQLYTVVATSHVENGIDVIASGRELLSRLQEEYFGNLDGKPFNVLKSAIQKVSGEFSKSWGEVEIAAVVVLGDVVYSAACGGAGVMISRGGSLATILGSRRGETITASGYPKDGDVILLATRAFFNKVPFGVIKAALSSSTPEGAVEALAPIIHGTESPGSMGAEILKFEYGKFDETQNESMTSQVATGQLPNVGVNQNIKAFIGRLAQKIPKRNIYIKPQFTEDVSPQSKKLTFSIAIILLILLMVSIGFGVRQKKNNDLKNKYQGVLQQAGNEVDQAISLASVSPDRSRELFGDAQSKIAQIDVLNIKDPALTALKQKISDSRASILGEYRITPEMFLDLTLLSSGFKGDTVAFSGGQIYVMDSLGSRIVSVDISTKKSQVVAGPSVINSATALACYESKVFVLEPDGIYEVDSGSTKVISKTWAGDALISAFAGNLYILDKAGSSVYRYQGQNNSFGDKQSWLSAGTNVNFASVNQISIDGSIYALYPNSKILKFSQGSPLNFNVTGAFPEIGNIDAINASPDNQNIYLLDRAGKRVVVTDKKGKYVAQYVDDSIGGAINLVASEADKKIILLTGDKLFSIDIKNL